MGGWGGNTISGEFTPLVGFIAGALLGVLCAARVRLPRDAKFGERFAFALTGFGVAAIGSLVVLVVFFLFAITTRGGKSTGLIDALQSFFNPLLATHVFFAPLVAVMPLEGGLKWLQGSVSPKGGHATISLRQLLLFQLYLVIFLGCWTGMRTAALSRVSQLDRAERKWEPRYWKVIADEAGKPIGLTIENADISPNTYEGVTQDLLDAAQEPWLQRIELKGFREPNRLAIKNLSNSRHLKEIVISNRYPARIDQLFVDGLGKLPSLESIDLTGGSIDAGDLTPLARLPKLTNLVIKNVLIQVKTFNHLADCGRLTSLVANEVVFDGAEPLKFAPTLKDLGVVTTFDFSLSEEGMRRMEALRSVTLDVGEIYERDIQAICAAPHLESLDLWGVRDPKDLLPLLRLQKLKRLSFTDPAQHFDPLDFTDSEYRHALRKLLMHPPLEAIACETDFLFHWDMEPFTEFSGSVTNDPGGVTQVAHGKQGTEINLEERRAQVKEELRALRREKGLGEMRMKFGPIPEAHLHLGRRESWQKLMAAQPKGGK